VDGRVNTGKLSTAGHMSLAPASHAHFWKTMLIALDHPVCRQKVEAFHGEGVKNSHSLESKQVFTNFFTSA
jgi:hypothetical protein